MAIIFEMVLLEREAAFNDFLGDGFAFLPCLVNQVLQQLTSSI